MSLDYKPCQPYATVNDVCNCKLDLDDPDILEVFERSLVYASRMVFEATGRRYTGICEYTIFPCRQPSGCGEEYFYDANIWGDHLPMLPVQVGPGVYKNISLCQCDETCFCGAWNKLPLPFAPVREIIEIMIDGVVLDPSAYRIVENSYIVRTDSEPWPICQDRNLPAGSVGTWSVTALYGWELPPEGKTLVADYACQLAHRCLGKPCQLPEEVKVISRQGVDYGFTNPMEYRKDLLTGYLPLDDWIIMIRGGRALWRPRVYKRNKKMLGELV
jgi:hypothetical protein